jgi:hypothetical protein
MALKNLEEVATEVIEELDKYAEDVIKYCRTNDLNEKKLYDLVVGREKEPLEREFLYIGFSTAMYPLREGACVSYKLSEMLGKRGYEKNRVEYFGYSHDPKDRPVSQESVNLAKEIIIALRKSCTSEDAETGTVFKTTNGDYLLDLKYGGNPFGNMKFEPHFELIKKVVIG